jgi:hypothetical protein
MHRSSHQGRSFHYRLFGLHVRSDLELPELCPANPVEEPDVRIHLGGDAATEMGTLLAIDEVAQFYVHGGSHIGVVPELGVPDRNLRLYLLGSAMGMLLHQRGLLPLHANAVEIDGKAVAFMGPSGAGKSTLAAWFHDRGCRVITDDVCVVRLEAEHAHVLAGLPRLRLWQDALEASGRRASQHERSYAGDEAWNKFDVAMDRTMEADAETELSLLFDLRRADSFKIGRVFGIEAADAVFANTYRGSFVRASNSQKTHWTTAMGVVRLVPVYRLERRWSKQDTDQQCERILQAVRQCLDNQRTDDRG